jgi:hypothetical protein
VELPGVGENVQEHIACRIGFELTAESQHETYDLMFDPEHAAKEMKLLCVAFTDLVSLC